MSDINEKRLKHNEQTYNLLEAHLEFRDEIDVKIILEETIKIAKELLDKMEK